MSRGKKRLEKIFSMGREERSESLRAVCEYGGQAVSMKDKLDGMGIITLKGNIIHDKIIHISFEKI